MTDLASGMTRKLLADAGIGPGWRVLDVGCGRGDVSFLAAALVGETGEVVGIDRDPIQLAVARERAHELGLANVAFAEADLHALPTGPDAFDAVIGRRVLMYLPDATQAVATLARALRPGGIMAFQEHSPLQRPEGGRKLPLHDRVRSWIWLTVDREGGNINMGFDLAAALTRAGLRLEHAHAEALVQTPTTSHPTGAIIRAMLPRIVQHGVASEAEIDIDTLDQRLADERSQTYPTYAGEFVFTALARKSDG
jgi:SAM-dependent methyltransferase